MKTLRRNISIEELVLLIRAKAPIFGKRVHGLSSFSAETIPSLNLESPYCVIHKVTASGAPYDKAKSTQRREAFISFVVCVSNLKQKGSGAGKEAVKAADSVDVCSSQIEDALLDDWKPTNFDLADTPILIDEGFINMDNTRLWHEIVWNVPYTVYNSAFGGLGNPGFLDDEDEEDVPFTQLAIIYGEEPVPIFLDQWVYGPMTDPPPRSDADIDAELATTASIYTRTTGEFQRTVSKAFEYTIRDNVRQQLVITVVGPGFEIILPAPPLEDEIPRPDPGYIFVYTLQGQQVFTYTGNAIQVPERFANG